MGSNMPAAFENLSVPGVVPVGYVADLSAELKKLRVMAAPLRFGAGAKGKVITSLAHGVPCVGTAMATEGMTLTNGQNIFIAASAAEFAARLVEVHESAEVWKRLSSGGTEVVLQKYSYAAGSQRVREGLAEIGAPTRTTLVA